MNQDKICLNNINNMFEYEKLARDIDSINDVETLRNFAKSYLKLYLCQQEVISNFKI